MIEVTPTRACESCAAVYPSHLKLAYSQTLLTVTLRWLLNGVYTEAFTLFCHLIFFASPK